MLHILMMKAGYNLGEENKYFQAALENFAADVAYVKSIRHLYDLGLSVKEIQKQCTYPISIGKIEAVIEKYEKEKNSTQGCVTFVQDVDKYGRKSFRAVRK